MALFAVVAILLGLYLSWRTIKLLQAIAKELKVQEDMGTERKWFNAIKEAMREKVYRDEK